MGKRLLTSVIGIGILYFLLHFGARSIIVPTISVLSVIGVYEMLFSTTLLRSKVLLSVSLCVAALIPVWVYYDGDWSVAVLAIFLCSIAAFGIAMFHPGVITFREICTVFFATLVIPAFFSCLISLYMGYQGTVMLILVLVISWGTDTFAMLCGMLLGKHKLIEHISPKKTVEGSLGGILFAVLLSALFAAIVNHFTDYSMPYIPVMLMALLGSVIAQLGDLTMSFIKREHNVKDFGSIMPGHGGILDRFDSVLFVAPAVQSVFFVISSFF